MTKQGDVVIAIDVAQARASVLFPSRLTLVYERNELEWSLVTDDLPISSPVLLYELSSYVDEALDLQATLEREYLTS